MIIKNSNDLQLAYENADSEAVLDVFALAMVVIELAVMESRHSVRQCHSFEQMVANRRHVLDTVVDAGPVADDLCTTMKLICVDPPNKSKLVRDATANSLVLDSFQPLASAHSDVVAAITDYFASVHRAVVDFVGCAATDVVPMKMVAIGLACATIHGDAYAMDYLI